MLIFGAKPTQNPVKSCKCLLLVTLGGNLLLILSEAQELPRLADNRQTSREIVSDFRVAVDRPKDYAEGLRGPGDGRTTPS
jgi:hypothetical protein